MDRSSSIRSSCRGRTERGFALITALLLSILFLGMIELALADATAAQREARRFRERISSQILADNAVELAAAGMLNKESDSSFETETDAGTMKGSFKKLPGGRFELAGDGLSAGLGVRATVVLEGRVVGSRIVIQQSRTR
jgi:type II secretory pathway component PulK